MRVKFSRLARKYSELCCWAGIAEEFMELWEDQPVLLGDVYPDVTTYIPYSVDKILESKQIYLDKVTVTAREVLKAGDIFDVRNLIDTCICGILDYPRGRPIIDFELDLTPETMRRIYNALGWCKEEFIINIIDNIGDKTYYKMAEYLGVEACDACVHSLADIMSVFTVKRLMEAATQIVIMDLKSRASGKYLAPMAQDGARYYGSHTPK